MRRDICYFFAADVRSVYNAYLSAATNAKFRRDCGQEPYHTISFGLNFSAKYNMNGGSCTIHFIPYRGGTAVDLRFSIVQLGGARYEKYAKDLTNDAVAVSGVAAQQLSLDINEFTNPLNKVTPDTVTSSDSIPEPEFIKTPTAPKTNLRMSSSMMSSATASGSKFCSNCGKALAETDSFCTECGTKIQKQSNSCPACGSATAPGSKFCANCGTKL